MIALNPKRRSPQTGDRPAYRTCGYRFSDWANVWFPKYSVIIPMIEATGDWQPC